MEGSDLGGQGAEGHHGANPLEGDLLDPSGLQAAEGRMDQSLDVGGRGARLGVIASQEVGAQDSRASEKKMFVKNELSVGIIFIIV